jgi:hypothetical protein
MPALATVQMATRNRRYNRKVIVKVLISIICSRHLGRKGRIWDNAHNLLPSSMQLRGPCPRPEPVLFAKAKNSLTTSSCGGGAAEGQWIFRRFKKSPF